MGRLNSSRETKSSGTHGDRGIFIFPVQLTTSRIGNFARLIRTLLYVMTIHTYIHTYCRESASTGPVLLKVVPVTGAAFSGITIDQLSTTNLRLDTVHI